LHALAKASSLGAKTVNGPGPFNVSSRPALEIALDSRMKLAFLLRIPNIESSKMVPPFSPARKLNQPH
jgi:hypothetical protein